MARVFMVFALVILASLNVSTYSACEDWLPFNHEWCYKLVDNTTRTYDDTITSCHQLDVDSTLAVVNNKEEQDFLSTYLFKTLGKVDNAWIGAKFSNESKYKWIGSTDLSYTNWDANGARNKANYCAQMQADEAVVGKWLGVSCEKKNLVLCQKMQTWTFARFQKIFLDERKQLRNSLEDANSDLANLKNSFNSSQNSHNCSQNSLSGLQNSLSGLQNSLSGLQNSHNDLKNNPVPIGFIYVQLPNQPEPKSLWPTVEWKAVSSEYSGHFFRVEGGNAVAFGHSQSDAFQGHRYSFNYGQNGNYALGNELYSDWISSTESENNKVKNTRKPISDGINGEPRTANETRPINYSVRIWKRIS